MNDVPAPGARLAEIRQRDLASAETWFRAPHSGPARAFQDRRWLLAELDRAQSTSPTSPDLSQDPHRTSRSDAREATPNETSTLPAQKDVLEWIVASFGQHAHNRDERAARLVEEAIEIAQAAGVPLAVLRRIADRVYARPAGELRQEIGGLGITILGLAANCGIDFAAETLREWQRVLSKPQDWWQYKHAEKVAAGTADLSLLPSERTMQS